MDNDIGTNDMLQGKPWHTVNTRPLLAFVIITSYEILKPDRDRDHCHQYTIEAVKFKKGKKQRAQDIPANTCQK